VLTVSPAPASASGFASWLPLLLLLPSLLPLLPSLPELAGCGFGSLCLVCESMAALMWCASYSCCSAAGRISLNIYLQQAERHNKDCV
jgi:hypothetical protein